MATIHDVARAAGVSTATVSRSFASKHPLRDETRQRVLQEAEKLNYRPRSSDRLRKPHDRTAGLLSSSIGFQYFASMPSDKIPSNAFYGPVLAGAQSEADRLGMHLMLHTTHRHKLSRSLPQMISEQAVPGMLLVGTADSEILELFAKFVPKIVIVDNRDPMMLHDCVITDGFRGSAQAVKYLLKLGHRRMAFVASRDADVSFDDRLNGYICTLFRAGIDMDRALICRIDEPDISTDMSVSVDEASAFLIGFAGADRPTAVVAGNDAHALAVLHACRQLKISVPGEMSIIGFDDTDFSAHTYPALTTMRVDKEQMGRIAVRRLQKRLTEEVRELVDPPIVVELPVRLIERGSCAAPGRGKA
jgi:DNA-binding LacI/PurR family transcriptional regulator